MGERGLGTRSAERMRAFTVTNLQSSRLDHLLEAGLLGFGNVAWPTTVISALSRRAGSFRAWCAYGRDRRE